MIQLIKQKTVTFPPEKKAAFCSKIIYLNLMINEFDALAFEQNHAANFERSQSRSIELSSQHDYTDGITYNYVKFDDLVLGRYWRNPWCDGWIFQTTGVGDGNKLEAETDYEAISLIKLSWKGIM